MKKTIIRIALFLAIVFSNLTAFGQNYIDFGLYPDTYCEPATLTVYNYSSIYIYQGPVEYKWYVDTTLVSTDMNPTSIPLLKGNHNVTLEVWDSLSFLGSKAYPVLIYGKVTDFNISTGPEACIGQKILFSIDNVSTVAWDFGYKSYFTPSTSSLYYPDFTYDKPGTYTVTLITSNYCTTDTVVKSIAVSNIAKPTLKSTDVLITSGCVNDPVKFGLNESYASYLWEFGDGSTSSLPNPEYTYKDAVAMSYSGKVTVTNQCGGTGSVNFTVNVSWGLLPDATFSQETLIGYSTCPGVPIRFNPSGSGSFFWEFGDGTTSNEKNPIHRYGVSGFYYPTLTVTNGCLNTASSSGTIDIYNYAENYIPTPFFMFDISMNGMKGQSDTMYICTKEIAKFKNQTYGDAGITYSWDFGDGKSFYGYDASHVYPDSGGVYYVTLTASNMCGDSRSSGKWVSVSSATQPSVVLKAIPDVTCAGDKVFFFDNDFDLRNNYAYSIDFGDGQSVTNLKTLGDTNIQILASHAYASTGAFIYTFSATNSCGNSVTSNGTITVDNNSSRMPFYDIQNTTEDQSWRDPVDWSIRRDVSDYEIDVPISWSLWNASLSQDFYLLLYYGSFNPAMGAYGNPSGYVHFNTALINNVISVKAYIPYSLKEQPSVGMAAAYYCGGIPRFSEKPEAFGSLMQGGISPINSIPIIPGGYEDLSLAGMDIKIDSLWDGICTSEKIESQWYQMVEPGVYAILNLWNTGDGYAYDFSYRDGITDYLKANTLGGGYYNRIGADSINFYSYTMCYNIFGDYKIFRPSANTIQFLPLGDGCADRSTFLSGTFTKIVQNSSDNNALCPGDKVQFKVVGGVSYLWSFGDGTTSTAQYPVHTYAAPNKYNARVIAKNGCGRSDTLYTKVTIMAKPATSSYFFILESEKFAKDSLHFQAENFNSNFIDNNSYLWNFGDGTSSSLKNPVHIYKQPGDYTVTLKNTNGCGSALRSEIVTIIAKYSQCEAQFSYSSDGGAAFFSDQSVGNPTSWSWDFGDGTFSNEQYPIHYYDVEGVYLVTLTTYNQLTNCFSSITKKAICGYFPCNADFNAVINTGSGLTNFISNSQYATHYYWDFGDGQFSTVSNPVHTFAKTGIYKVCLTIWDSANACKSSICKDVMFMSAGETYTKADFSFYTNSADSTVFFNDLSTQNATDWYWTMGDGKVMKTQNPVYKYAKPGNYKVCLTVFDQVSSQTSTMCKEVRIGDLLCGTGTSFSYFIDPVAKNVKFFSLTSAAIDNYFWTFGDGQSSTLPNPEINFTKPGYYKVTLTVRNSYDNCSDKFSQYIQVGSVSCRAGFVSRVNPDNATVNFKDDSKGLIDYYYWDFGDGTFSVQPNPDHTYKKAGLYTVSQTVINNLNGCLDNFVQPLQVGEISCAADFVTYVDSINYTAYYTNRILGESTLLLWSFGDGSFATEQNPVHEFPGEGIYSTGLNTYDANNGCMDYYQEKLIVGGIGVDCDADFVYFTDPATSAVTFSNKSTGDIVDWTWNFGDGYDNSKESDPVYTYTKPGYYYVCLTVTNSSGIRNMGCKWVLVQPSTSNECKANFMFTVDSSNLTAKFVDNSFGDINKYTWDFGDSKSDSVSYETNPNHTYNQKGFYLVKLKVENTTTGCVSNDYKLLNVADTMELRAGFGYEAKDYNKKFTGYPVDLVSASSGDGATVEWDFGDKNLKKGAGPEFTVMDSTTGIVTHYYQIPGKYLVCIRIKDPISDQIDEYCSMISTKWAIGVNEITESELNLNVYPNPFVDYTNISYSLPKPQFVELAVYDQLGRRIETLTRARKDSGNYQVVWQAQTVSPGIYHLKLITGDEIITRQLVITR